MLKKLAYTLLVLSFSLGMLGVTGPALALGNSHTVKGTLIAISTRTRIVTVAPLRGAHVKVRIARGALIVRKGKAGTFAKLRVGDRVNLKVNNSNNQAEDVDDNPGQFDIHGTVQAVDTTANTIMIASEDGGNAVTLNVDSSTLVERNGSPAVLGDLLVGDKVEAQYDSTTMLASSIKAEVEDSEVEGTFAAFDTTANTLTITPQDGSANIVLNILPSTVFTSNDTVISPASLQVGDQVQAEYDSASMNASEVEVDSSGSQDSGINK